MEEEIKTSSRVLLVSAVVLLVVLITGPFGHKFGVIEVGPALQSVVIAMIGGGLVFLCGIVFLVLAVRGGFSKNRNLVAVAMVVGLIPAIFLVPQLLSAGGLPLIHDITTDPDNPPEFVAIAPLREKAPNPVGYGTQEGWPPEKLGAETRTAYPDLMPFRTEMTVVEAVDRAEEVLGEMGLEIVAKDGDEGRVEATATTFWFGFKDDVVVRIAHGEEESVIDLRSKSRVGQGDLGANAARIREFIDRFE